MEDLQKTLEQYSVSSIDTLKYARLKIDVQHLVYEWDDVDAVFALRTAPQQPVPKKLKHKIDRIK